MREVGNTRTHKGRHRDTDTERRGHMVTEAGFTSSRRDLGEPARPADTSISDIRPPERRDSTVLLCGRSPGTLPRGPELRAPRPGDEACAHETVADLLSRFPSGEQGAGLTFRTSTEAASGNSSHL